MSDNDLQSTMSMRLDGTLQPLGQAAKGVDVLDKAVQKLHRSSSDYQKNASRPFREGGEHAGKFGKEVQELGHALGRLRGPLGELAHQGFGGAGLAGGFGRVAVAAGLMGIAIEASTKIVEARMDRIKLAVEAEEKYEKALEAGGAAIKSHALAGLSHDAPIRAVVSAGGASARGAAEDLAHAYNIPLDDAYRGVASSYKRGVRTEADRGAVLAAAAQVAKAGGDFGGAVEAITSNPGLLARLRQHTPQANLEVAARVHQTTVTGQPYGASVSGLLAAQDAVANDKFLSQANVGQGVKNKTEASDIGRVEDGTAVGALRQALSEAMDPMAKAIGEFTRTRQLELDVLKRFADAQPLLLRALAAATPAGSYQTQLERKEAATGTGD